MLDPDKPDPPPRTFTLKPKEFERVNAPPGTQEASAAHDVYAIRQELRAREQAAGLDAVEVKAVRSRRRRDYWLLLATVNPALAVTAWLGRGNMFVLVSAAAGIILATIGLTWIMWFVMDDY
jgi:hypothetical protein